MGSSCVSVTSVVVPACTVLPATGTMGAGPAAGGRGDAAVAQAHPGRIDAARAATHGRRLCIHLGLAGVHRALGHKALRQQFAAAGQLALCIGQRGLVLLQLGLGLAQAGLRGAGIGA